VVKIGDERRMEKKIMGALICMLFAIATLSNAADINIVFNGGQVLASRLEQIETLSLNMQPPIEWSKCFGGIKDDYGLSVQETKDGGYIITGFTESSGSGGFDMWLIKTDSNGSKLWTRFFGGALNDFGYSVQQTREGGYIITGFTESFGSGRSDIWLIKTDSNGSKLWTRFFGGPDLERGYSVQQTIDGGYIITGETWSFGSGWSDVWLIKTDKNGNKLWTKCFGGPDLERGYSVQQTSEGGYIVTGFTESFGSGGSDVWLIKTDNNGNKLWTKCFGGSSYEYGYCVQQTTDSGYIIVGFTDSFGSGWSDVWLIKTDSNGNKLWTKCLGGTKMEYGYCVQQTRDGGYIVTGKTRSFGSGGFDVWLIKTDSNGDTLWTKCLGGTKMEYGRSVQQTKDGGYIIVGSTESFGSGGTDVLLIKVALENDPPFTPEVPSGPSVGYLDVSYSYSTRAFDPDDDRVRYYFDWGDGSGDWTGYVESGEFASVSHVWNITGTYEVKVKAQDEHGAESIFSSALEVIIQEPTSDLECDGSLIWSRVKPGDTLKGSFTVENIGGPASKLDWEVSKYPDWGTWTFKPSEGDDLTPEEGKIRVEVSVVAPDERIQEFTGNVTIVNKENKDDFEKINVYLETSKNKCYAKNTLFTRFIVRFPILQRLNLS
jgi:predicted secreted protein